MANLAINDLSRDVTLDDAAMGNIRGGRMFGGFGWIRPYQSGLGGGAGGGFGSPTTNIFIGQINNTQNIYNANKYFVGDNQSFLVNNNAFVNVDASATNGSNLGINLLLGQAGL